MPAHQLAVSSLDPISRMQAFGEFGAYASLLAASRPDRDATRRLKFFDHSWNGYTVFAQGINHIDSPTRCGSTRFPYSYHGCGCTACLGFLADKRPGVFRCPHEKHPHCTAPCADQDAWALTAPSRFVPLALRWSQSRSPHPRTSPEARSPDAPARF